MNVIEIIKVIVFGLIEGITEWLPVSSTGHMILLNEIMPMNVSEDFYTMFEVVIQLGAIMAVVVLFWKKIWPFGKKENPHPLASNGVGQWIKKDIFSLWFHILVSCVPAAIIGLLFDDLFTKWFYNYTTVSIMLIVVGVAFIVAENYYKNKESKINSLSEITYQAAFVIGVFQLIAAVFPGTSRSGATIIGALLIGVSRKVAAEYTFFLAIPVMFGASVLKLFKFGTFTTHEFLYLLIGMVVAFVTSMFVIKFLLDFIKKHDFKVFGWYRIVLGIVVLICGFVGIIGA